MYMYHVQYSSMSCSTAITLVSLIQFQKFYDFLKALKEIFQMMVSIQNSVGEIICHFSALDHRL